MKFPVRSPVPVPFLPGPITLCTQVPIGGGGVTALLQSATGMAQEVIWDGVSVATAAEETVWSPIEIPGRISNTLISQFAIPARATVQRTYCIRSASVP